VKCKSEEKVTEGVSCIKGRFQCHLIDIYEDTINITESILNNNECDSEQQPPIDEVDSSSSSSSVKHFLSKYSENVQIDKEFIEEDDNTLPGSFSDTLLAYLSNRGEYGCEDTRYCWSVLVFTCRNSYWKETDDWIEECVIVQTDENVTKINNPIN
ncbi:unnamed protein product, partial [Trichobilharzia regenti]